MIESNLAVSAPHSDLGDTILHQAKPTDAAGFYRHAIVAAPDLGKALFGLGVALAKSRQTESSIRALKRSIMCSPDCGEHHYALGVSYLNNGKTVLSIRPFINSITLEPGRSEAHTALAIAFQHIYKFTHSRACHERAAQLNPNDPAVIHNLGAALLDAGQIDAARRAFERAVELDPHSGPSYRALAEASSASEFDHHLPALERLAREKAMSPPAEQVDPHFALAKAYADRKEHKLSFEHLLIGNRLKRGSVNYDESAALTAFNRIEDTFNSAFDCRRLTTETQAPVPIFVVGMPRSGTTLVEQILASHPQIFGAGELNDLWQLVNIVQHKTGVTFPDSISAASEEMLLDLRENYLRRLRFIAPHSNYVIDKMPDNFKLVGLINLIIPEAKIIHLVRDPMDTCLSCFSKLFSGEHSYSYDLGELGRYYNSYWKLMQHWRDILPSGVMLDVHYEDVVADLKGQTQRMLLHCGLPWSDDCLDFHKTQRDVRTASNTQVRQPINNKSVGRWHALGDALLPLLDMLTFDRAYREKAYREKR